MTSWIDNEININSFKDIRLGKRFKKLFQCLSERVGDSIPIACQDWASVKGAYRFFSNPNSNIEGVLGGHYSATKARCNEIDGSILVLHDTTEIAYNRSKSEGIGSHRIYSNKRGFYSSDKEVHKCGIYMHPSLTLTTEGLPLGLANNIFWSRKNFKNSREVQKKKNYSRIPISEKESYCWIQGLESSNKLLENLEKLIHIADREADIYEFFHTAISQNSHFLVRSKSNRKTSDNEFEKIFEVMNSS